MIGPDDETPGVDARPDRITVRLVDHCGSDLALTPDAARGLAFSLLRATLRPDQREVLTDALESWRSQSVDYGHVTEDGGQAHESVVDELANALGLTVLG